MLRPDAREPEAGQARAIQATPAVGPEGWIDLAGEKREQTKRVEGDGKGQPSATSGVHEVLRAPGRPLDPLTRAAMEQRLGHDFSRVRVHTDAAAELSARALNARAYTVGTEIVFGAHEFAPEDREGRGLLTHELTHVVQQRNARIDISAVEPRGSAAECEADAAAFDAAAERATKRPSAAPRGIPRDAGWASREIPDVHGMGYNAIYKHAGPDSTGAVLALASLETPRRFVDIEKYKGLEAPVRKSILALEPHAAGTACAGWFDLLRANDPDFKPTLTREQVRAGEAAYHASTREVILQRKVESVKEELPRLGATAIDARWKDIKYGLVTAARTPNHGIKAEPLFWIWLKYWSDKHKFAQDLRKAILNAESEADKDAYLRKLFEYDEGDRNALGADYAKAEADIALSEFMFRHSVHAMELLRASDEIGRSLTLEELDEKVMEWGKGWDLLVGGLEMALTFGRGGPAPTRSEPAKSEPAKSEPAKSEPAKTAPPPSPTAKPGSPPRLAEGQGRGQVSGTPPTGMLRDLDAPSRSVQVDAAHPLLKGNGPANANDPPPPPRSQAQKIAINAPEDFARPRLIETTDPGQSRSSQRRDQPTAIAGKPPSGDKPKIGAPKTSSGIKAGAQEKAMLTEQDIVRIRQLAEWEKRGKIRGDVHGLRVRLKSNDPDTLRAARNEFDEASADIAEGKTPHVEDYAEDLRPEAPKTERISTGGKKRIDFNGWIKKRLPTGNDQWEYRDWLKTSHKVGSIEHDHPAPGTPAAEALVRTWEEEMGRRR